MSIRGVKAMKSYVYLDVLFFVNLIVNYVMLLATGKMTGKPLKTNRAVFASCLGGLYSVCALTLPLQPFFGFPARVVFGLFMVALSYPEVRGFSFVALAGSFYLCSALVAGTAMALYMWGKPGLPRYSVIGQEYSGAQWWTLALALVVVSSSGFLWRALNFSGIRRVPLMQVEITFDGHCIPVTGMVDTGNDLRDPVSGLPVIIVDWDSLKGIMPHEVSHFFLSAWDLVTARLTESPVGKRLRLIPYTNVSGNRGILPGFKPDALYLTGKHGRLRKDAVIGVSGKRLSPQGLYQALLHPELVNL